MATTHHYFEGEIFWALRGIDNKFAPGHWKISLKPSPAGQKEIAASGITVKPKDGMYTFKRKTEQTFKGQLTKFDPPKFLIQKDGKTIEFDGQIGNGSKGQVKVEVYDTSLGKKGHRYLAVLVTDLVPYEAAPKAENPEALQQVPF